MAASLTPAAIDVIVESVARGSSIRMAAKANGFSDDQVDQWRRIARGEPNHRNGPPFSQAYIQAVAALTERCERAIGERYVVLTNALYENATTRNAKTGWFDSQAADKLLAKAPETRDAWYEQRGIVQEQRILEAAYQEVRSLSDAELEALVSESLPQLPAPPLPPHTGPKGGWTDEGAAE